MRAWLPSLISLLLFPVAYAVTLAWNPSPSAGVLGYKLYSGTASKIYGSPVDVGNSLTATFNTSTGLTYFFAVSAYNVVQESDLSDELAYGVTVTNSVPGPHVGLRWSTNVAVSPVVFWTYNAAFCDVLEWSPDLATWQTIAPSFYTISGGEVRVSISTVRPVRFFRVRRSVCVP